MASPAGFEPGIHTPDSVLIKGQNSSGNSEAIGVVGDAAKVTAGILSEVGDSADLPLSANKRTTIDLVSTFGSDAVGKPYRLDANTECRIKFADSGDRVLCDGSDGNSTVISIPNATGQTLPSDMDFGTNDICVEAWVSWQGWVTSFPSLCFIGDGGASQAKLQVDLSSASTPTPGIRLNLRADDSTVLISGATYAFAAPYGYSDDVRHLVINIVRNGDATSTVEIYVDGALIVNTTWDETGNGAKTVNMSAVTNGRFALLGTFNGTPQQDSRLSAFRVYNSSLTSNQVEHRTNIGPYNLPTDGKFPAAYFDGNEYTADTDTAVLRGAGGTNILTLNHASSDLNLATWDGGIPATSADSPRLIGSMEPNKIWVAGGQYLNVYPATDGNMTITRVG